MKRRSLLWMTAVMGKTSSNQHTHTQRRGCPAVGSPFFYFKGGNRLSIVFEHIEPEELPSKRGIELQTALFNQFQQFHNKNHRDDKQIEELLLRQKQWALNNPQWFKAQGMPIFSPSSADKCERELFYKALKMHRDEQTQFPFQRRWTRNSTAVHEATQRDLLYMEKLLPEPAFVVKRDAQGFPLWEKSSQQIRQFTHNGEQFCVAGMMDGILTYTPDNSTVGFEFKTKSNSVAQVGHFKMKAPAEHHVAQAVGYSLIFGINEFIFMYEAVAKDQWGKGPDAKMDIRTFYLEVTEEDRQKLLNKLAGVTRAIRLEQTPAPNRNKCMFCEFKTTCGGMA